MSDELLEGPEGVSRRSMLKKSALVGGTMVWAAPVVNSFTSPAFGQTDGTPDLEGDKGISYIALVYSCTGTGTRYIKFENFNTNGTAECESGSFETPQCEFPDTSGQGDHEDDCDLFNIEVVESEGDDVTVVRITIDGDGCVIDGVGVGKCGNPENENSDGECIEGVLSNDNRTITFSDCGL